jgi:hypothetical protein
MTLSLFTSTGSLQVQLIEVLDMFDAPKIRRASFLSWGKKTAQAERKNTYLEVSIVDEHGGAVMTNQTATKSVMVNAPSLLFGEEFVFQHVSSLHTLMVSLCFLSSIEGSISNQVSGTAQIPLSRLEENQQVCVITLPSRFLV